MQMWCAEGNNHGISQGSYKLGAYFLGCNAFVYTEGTATATESSSELLLMSVIKLEELMVVYGTNQNTD